MIKGHETKRTMTLPNTASWNYAKLQYYLCRRENRDHLNILAISCVASSKSSFHDAESFYFFLPLTYIHNFSTSLVGSLVKHCHTGLWCHEHNLTTNTVGVKSFIATYSGYMTKWQLQLYIQITAMPHHRWKQNPQFLMCLNCVFRLVAVHKETLQKTKNDSKFLTIIPSHVIHCEIPNSSFHISPFYLLWHTAEKTIGK